MFQETGNSHDVSEKKKSVTIKKSPRPNENQETANLSQNNAQKFPELDEEIEQFFKKSFEELIQIAEILHIPSYQQMNRQDLIFAILKEQMIKNDLDFTVGVLETMENGFGFLRQSNSNYSKSYNDIYVPPTFIKQFGLRKGDTIAGFIKDARNNNENNNKGGDKFKALLKIVSVNYQPASKKEKRPTFDSLIPIYPNEAFNLENIENPTLSTRILSLFSPIGKGQRSLIVAPPRTGKTIILQDIANAIVENHPNVYIIVLLIDERPEEVTDMQRSIRGEVISSTFDEEPDKHCHVAEIVLEKAKRLVECGLDVVIFLDSITRLGRAYNQNIPASGKVLSGGVDAKALIGPKKFFGAARNIEKGGSLTIIGTALVDTGSRMDEVIFEEFKGTGNMEVNLDRGMAEKRIFPAIDIFKSGTRKEDLLLSPKELDVIWHLREQLASRKADAGEVLKLIIEKLKEFKTNKAFLSSLNFNNTKNI
jgi:transcription termination factor Rho